MAKSIRTQLDIIKDTGVVEEANTPDTDYYTSSIDASGLDNVVLAITHVNSNGAATTCDVRAEASFDNENWIDLETFLDASFVKTISVASIHGLFTIQANPFPYLRMYFKSVTNAGDSVTAWAAGAGTQ